MGVGDVVAEDDEVGGEERVVLRRGGVVEVEEVGAWRVAERDLEGEGLVEVTEGRRCGGCVGREGQAAERLSVVIP